MLRMCAARRAVGVDAVWNVMTGTTATEGGLIEDFARNLARARRTGTTIPMPVDLLPSMEVAESVQALAVEALGGRQRGYSILTVDRQMPHGRDLIYGPMMDECLLENHSRYALPQGVYGAQVGFVFTIGRPYPYAESISPETIVSAIAKCDLAVAVFGHRLRSPVRWDLRYSTADFGLHVATFRGDRIEHWTGLGGATNAVTFSIDDNEISRLPAAAFYDRALRGLVGLADKLTAGGHHLNAGDVVAAGSSVPMLQILPRQHVRVEIADYARADCFFM